MSDSTNQTQLIKLLVSQTPEGAKPDLTTTLDVAATISAVLWPLVALIVLLVYRHKLSDLIAGILSRVKKLEFAGVTLEWAEVKELSTEWLVPGGELDLRSSSAGLEVFESSGTNILTQLDQPFAGDYAVIDLGEGNEWLSSRLFILAVLFGELRGLKALVFVDAKEKVSKRFVGWTEPGTLVQALSIRYPRLQAAYSVARSMIDKPRQVFLPPNNVWVTQMGLVDSQAGMDLFKQFLFHLKPKDPGVIPPNEINDWTPMLANPGFSEYAGAPNLPTDLSEWVELKGIRFYEYAQWMNRRNLGELLGENLNMAVVDREEIKGKSESKKIRAVLLQDGNFVALIKDGDRFDRLVDRRALMERAVKANLAEN
jgi:hypothetical protein